MDGEGRNPGDAPLSTEGFEEQQEKFHEAMAAVASAADPMTWNAWQKEGRDLLESTFPDCRQECVRQGVPWERYLSELRAEIMQEVHGPGWKQQCKMGPTAKAMAVAKAAGGDGAPPVSGEGADSPGASWARAVELLGLAADSPRAAPAAAAAARGAESASRPGPGGGSAGGAALPRRLRVSLVSGPPFGSH